MKKIILVLFMALILGASAKLEAKTKYQALENQDGVTFTYKWKSSKFLKKDSPLILKIKIENSNDYAGNINFTVEYFWQGIRTASSEEQAFCVKANKSLVGKIKKFGFDKAKYTNEQILSEDFIMELTGIKVVKTEGCK